MDKESEATKKNDILDKAENVILQKVEQYQQSPQSMTDKDCYALLQLIVTEGKILAIRNNTDNELPYC